MFVEGFGLQWCVIHTVAFGCARTRAVFEGLPVRGLGIWRFSFRVPWFMVAAMV